MLDLASRGLIAFREERRAARRGTRSASTSTRPRATPTSRRSAALNARRPTGPAEERRAPQAALERRRTGRRVHHARRPAQVRHGRGRLRQGARGARRRPGLVRREAEQGRRSLDRPRRRWPSWPAGSRDLARPQHPDLGPGPASAAAAIAGGIVIIVFAQVMPAVTMPGRDDPGDAGGLPADAPEDDGPGPLDAAGRRRSRAAWLDTPDQAVVWGTALGLQGEIEEVLSRSLEDVQAGRDRGAVALLPVLVPDLERHVVHGRGGAAAAAAASSPTRGSRTSAG